MASAEVESLDFNRQQTFDIPNDDEKSVKLSEMSHRLSTPKPIMHLGSSTEVTRIHLFNFF